MCDCVVKWCLCGVGWVDVDVLMIFGDISEDIDLCLVDDMLGWYIDFFVDYCMEIVCWYCLGDYWNCYVKVFWNRFGLVFILMFLFIGRMVFVMYVLLGLYRNCRVVVMFFGCFIWFNGIWVLMWLWIVLLVVVNVVILFINGFGVSVLMVICCIVSFLVSICVMWCIVVLDVE